MPIFTSAGVALCSQHNLCWFIMNQWFMQHMAPLLPAHTAHVRWVLSFGVTRENALSGGVWGAILFLLLSSLNLLLSIHQIAVMRSQSAPIPPFWHLAPPSFSLQCQWLDLISCALDCSFAFCTTTVCAKQFLLFYWLFPQVLPTW